MKYKKKPCELVQELMNSGEMTREEAEETFKEMRRLVREEEEDPEELLLDYGIDLDYAIDLF